MFHSFQKLKSGFTFMIFMINYFVRNGFTKEDTEGTEKIFFKYNPTNKRLKLCVSVSSVVNPVYFVVPRTTRLVRTILLLLFPSSFPSSFSISSLMALLPTSLLCFFTVVSFWSVLWEWLRCEPADGHFVRHFPSHQFAGMDARCCFVVDGKETVRTVGAFQQGGSNGNCFLAGITQLDHALVYRNPVLLHGIQIPVPPVLGDFEVRGGAVKKMRLHPVCIIYSTAANEPA